MNERELALSAAGPAYTLAYRLEGSRDAAVEIASAALADAARALPGLRGAAPTPAWLSRFVVESWRARRRRQKRDAFLSAATLGLTGAPEEPPPPNEPAQAALLRLDPDARALVVLRDALHLPESEAAAILSLSPAEAAAKLSSARLALAAAGVGESAAQSLPRLEPPQDLAESSLPGPAGEGRRDWVFLPPSLRPLAFALSSGIVALWIWQRVVVRPPLAQAPTGPEPRLDSGAEAPLSQIDVSRAASGLAPSADAHAQSQALGLAPQPGAALPGPAKASGRPLSSDTPAPAPATMSEEERSARNIAMFADLERQKRELGITGVPEESAAQRREEALRRAGLLPPQGAPAAAVVRATPRMLSSGDESGGGLPAAAPAPPPAAGAGRSAPDAALVLSDADSLAASWTLLGLPGSAPSVDFTRERAVLVKPTGAKVVSVVAGATAVVVTFRRLGDGETPSPVADRFARLPPTPAAVEIIDANAR